LIINVGEITAINHLAKTGIDRGQSPVSARALFKPSILQILP
jgi:hypothetical protein